MIFGKLIGEGVLLAFGSLVTNKLRTFLSLMGITIGIFSIIFVFTVVDSLEAHLRSDVASLGDDVIFIQKWPWNFEGEYPWWKYLSRPVAKIEELSDIQRRSRYAEASAFYCSADKTIKYKSNSIEGVDIISVSQDYNKVKNLDIFYGRYFSESESISGRGVVVLGYTIADVLFQGKDPIGKSITIMGRKVMVIGVIALQGESILGGSTDTQVFVPEMFAKDIIKESDPMIMVKAKAGVTNEQLSDELRGIMRSLRKLQPLAEDNFSLNETSIVSKGFDGLFSMLHVVGLLIGGFSIIVGGFGIANIMFVSVRERRNSIGIQKSLGAKRYFILLQFLFESIMLCILGGLLGLFLIYIADFFVSDLFDMEVNLSLYNTCLGLGISALIGIVSGIIPAYSAAKLDPVEAIRSN